MPTLKRKAARRNVIKLRTTRKFVTSATPKRSGGRIKQPVTKPIHDHD